MTTSASDALRILPAGPMELYEERYFKILADPSDVWRHRLFELMVYAGLNRLPAAAANAKEWWNRIR